VNSGVLYNRETRAVSSIQPSGAGTPGLADLAGSTSNLSVDGQNGVYLTGAWRGSLVAGGIARAARSAWWMATWRAGARTMARRAGWRLFAAAKRRAAGW